MRNRTELASSVGARLRQALRDNQQWLSALGYTATGFIMANTSIFGGISPFGVAFCASLQGGAAISAALGAVIGYTFSAAMLTNMKYLAAVLLVAAAKWLFGSGRGSLGKIIAVRHSAVSSVVTVFFALLVAGAAVIFSSDYTLYDLLLNISEILLACGVTYFFTRALSSLGDGWVGVSKADLSCIIISFAIIVMGFESIEISNLSIGRMMSVLVILLCARSCGEAGGSISGVAAGIAMGLAGGDISYVTAAYGFGGLIAGVFGSMGKLAAASSFIIVNAVAAFLTQDSVTIYNSLFEVFVSSVIFIIIPQNWMIRLRPITPTAKNEDNYARNILRDRLGDISAALSEIGATTKKVSDSLEKMESPGPVDVAARVADRVCRRCNMKSTCWQFSYNDTAKAMSTSLGVLKRCGSISRSRAPRYFAQNCSKLDDLLAELNSQFQGYTSREGVHRKVSRVRSVVTDQFESLSMMLNEIAYDICSVKVFDEQKARRVCDYFEKAGVEASRVQAYNDESERLCVSFVTPNYHVAKLHRSKATLDLCELLEADFDLPQITARDHYATVVFAEKATFTVELGAYQIAGDGNKLCGDAYEYIKNNSGKSHFILSDGMGSGGGAAVDSSMASGLISQLLAVGISHEAALKMVNSALIIKSGEESLATIDVTTIDLYTGRADFYKAGAAPTYLIKNGKAGYVESTSLPAGILRNVAFEHNVMALRENDVVVMVSDGVTATGPDWVKSELENLKGSEMQRLAEKLAMTAKARRTDNREDDITVIAIAIRRTD